MPLIPQLQSQRLASFGWCDEWWQAIIASHNIEKYQGDYDFESLSKFSKENQIPLHPNFTYFWADLDVQEINDFRKNGNN